MSEKHYVLPSLLFLISLAGSASPGISQYFDSDGNPAPSELRKSTDDLLPGASRYSAPEGVELRKDIKYEYYPVFGKTFSELVRSSEENGPFNIKKNRRFPSKYEWSPGWSYQFDYTYALDEETGTVHVALEIADIDIKYNITITLPILIDDTSLNPIEKNMWKIYFLRLLEHEHDHVKIIQDNESKNKVLNSIREINYLIFDQKKGLDIEKTVSIFLKDETSKIGRDWIKQIKDRNDAYDRLTEYGSRHEQKESFFNKIR